MVLTHHSGTTRSSGAPCGAPSLHDWYNGVQKWDCRKEGCGPGGTACCQRFQLCSVRGFAVKGGRGRGCRAPVMVDASELPQDLRVQLAALDQARSRASSARRSARPGAPPPPRPALLHHLPTHPAFPIHPTLAVTRLPCSDHLLLFLSSLDCGAASRCHVGGSGRKTRGLWTTCYQAQYTKETHSCSRTFISLLTCIDVREQFCELGRC